MRNNPARFSNWRRFHTTHVRAYSLMLTLQVIIAGVYRQLLYRYCSEILEETASADCVVWTRACETVLTGTRAIEWTYSGSSDTADWYSRWPQETTPRPHLSFAALSIQVIRCTNGFKSFYQPVNWTMIRRCFSSLLYNVLYFTKDNMLLRDAFII